MSKKFTIRTKDGEVSVPKIFKIVIPDGDKEITYTMFKVLPHKRVKDVCLQYVLPTSFITNVCTANRFFKKKDFDGAIEITKEEWNDTVRCAVERFLEDALI